MRKVILFLTFLLSSNLAFSQVDLVPTSISGPSSAKAGENISVTIKVQNQGTQKPSGGFKITVYLSTNSTITTSDTEIGSWTETVQLGAGSGITTTETVNVPSGMTSGSYYIGVIIDSSNWIAESNEDNNNLASNNTITIEALGNSLMISSITPSSTQTLEPGQSQKYTITVVDQNGDLVSSATVGESDYVQSSSINETTNSSGQATYITTVPSGKSEGTYALEFKAYKSGYESSSLVRRYVNVSKLEPNSLTISSITPSSTQTLEPGQSQQYIITVVDQNGDPVSSATVGESDYVQNSSINETTNSSGQATYITTVPSGKSEGRYALEFRASKSEYRSSSLVSREVIVEFPEIDPNKNYIRFLEGIIKQYESLTGESITNNYNSGHKHIFTLSFGIEKYGLDLKLQLVFDLDDLFKITEEGNTGWVTYWVNINTGAGLGIAPPITGLTVSSWDRSLNLDDPRFKPKFTALSGEVALYKLDFLNIDNTGVITAGDLGWQASTTLAGIEIGDFSFNTIKGEVSRDLLLNIIQSGLESLSTGTIYDYSSLTRKIFNDLFVIEASLSGIEIRKKDNSLHVPFTSYDSPGPEVDLHPKYSNEIIRHRGGVDLNNDGFTDNAYDVTKLIDGEPAVYDDLFVYMYTDPRVEKDYYIEVGSVPEGWFIEAKDKYGNTAGKRYEFSSAPNANIGTEWLVATTNSNIETVYAKFRLYENKTWPSSDILIDEWVVDFTNNTDIINNYPIKPRPISPEENENISTTTPKFVWSDFVSDDLGESQDGYQIRVRESDTEDERVIYDTGYIYDPSASSHTYKPEKYNSEDPVTGISRISESLLNNKKYHWHVRYRDLGGDWSAWSADGEGNLQHFTTDFSGTNTPPTIAIDNGPLSGSTINFSDPAFQWSGSDSDGTVVEYEVELSGPTLEGFTTSSDFYQFSNLNNGNYVFRIRAIDDQGAYSSWAERSFSVDVNSENVPPSASIISGPEEGGILDFNDPLFKWSGNDTDGTISGYEVELQGPGPSKFFSENTTHQFVGLENGSYTFRVRAQDNDGDWSEWVERNFSVDVSVVEIKFASTTSTYTENDDLNLACKDQLGNNYRLADWVEIEAFYQEAGSLKSFFEAVKLNDQDGKNMLVKRSGNRWYSSSRHYFITRHDGNKPSGYLAHENINNYELSLGSWYGMNMRALCFDTEANKPPTVSIDSGPTEGSTIDIENPVFEWSGDDSDGSVSGYKVELLGPSSSNFSTTESSYQFADLANGGYTFRVQSLDNDGEKSDWAERNFTVKVIEEEKTLAVSTNKITFASEGGSKSFNITSNISWSINNNQSWIDVVPNSGNDNGEITVTAEANTLSSSRNGTINISGEGLSETVEINQVAKDVVVIMSGYKKGWNLVSIPEEINGKNIDDYFPSLSNSAVYEFDDQYMDMNSLEVGKGYWVKLKENMEVEFSGSTLSSLTISLNQGWNLIGSIAEELNTTTDILDDGNILESPTVWESNYNASTGEYELVETNQIQPGKGYFIKATKSGEITLQKQ